MMSVSVGCDLVLAPPTQAEAADEVTKQQMSQLEGMDLSE